jgi:hypothetical protein
MIGKHDCYRVSLPPFPWRHLRSEGLRAADSGRALTSTDSSCCNDHPVLIRSVPPFPLFGRSFLSIVKSLFPACTELYRTGNGHKSIKHLLSHGLYGTVSMAQAMQIWTCPYKVVNSASGKSLCDGQKVPSREDVCESRQMGLGSTELGLVVGIWVAILSFADGFLTNRPRQCDGNSSLSC